MEIKTKFNIKDEVWYLFENKIHTGWISRIETDSKYEYGQLSKVYIKYTIGVSIELSEDRLFSTKEDLLKSL